MQKLFWFELHAGVHAYSSFGFIAACLVPAISAYQYLTDQKTAHAELSEVKFSYTLDWEQLAGVYAVFMLLFGLLAYGTHSKRRLFLLPYILVMVFVLVLCFVIILVSFFKGNRAILVFAPALFVLCYTYAAVWALFLSLDAQQNQNTLLFDDSSAYK